MGGGAAGNGRNTVIEVQHLTKRYGPLTALDDLSFTAQPGKIYGFLGPNGAGKTTTMNIMTGYLAATDGTVLIDGKDIQKEPEEAKSRIGYLPEVPPVYDDMTVYEYLRFAAELKKVPRGDRFDACSAAMQAAEIEEVADRLIRNLSKGYRQRVGLAQALVGNPKVLILDEPTAGLDPEQQRQMFDYIRSFKKDHTIILSSHILSDISSIADEIWILNEGKLVASDTPENLRSHLESRQEITLLVQGSEESIRRALEGISRIAEFSSSKEPDGTLRFTILSDAEEDIRPDISRAAVYAGAAILGISRAEKSLEDVFFRLTGADVPERIFAENKDAPAGNGAADEPEQPGKEEISARTDPPSGASTGFVLPEDGESNEAADGKEES